MTAGKNKGLNKKKKTGRKIIDPFSRKEWFDISVPTFFSKRKAGRTVATKTTGQKTSRDSLLGRLVTLSPGDLPTKGGEDFRKITLKIDEVQGTQCLTSFAGMSMTADKLRSLVRKNHTMIEAYSDVRTTDGYVLRLFAIGFTQRRPNQTRVTSYAQSGQARQIRKKMVHVMTREASKSDISQLVLKLSTDVLSKAMVRQAQAIYPLQNVYIRTVKVLKAPKGDVGRLIELHGGTEAIKAMDAAAVAAAAAAPVVERPAEVEAAAADE